MDDILILEAVQTLAEHLQLSASESERFASAIQDGYGAQSAILVLRDAAPIRTFPRVSPASWQPDFVHAVQAGFQPGAHPLHDRGNFYCMDLSSIFESVPMLTLPDSPRFILDLCSSPGGKALFAWRALLQDTEGLLVCNEVSKPRLNPLVLNLERCKIPGAMATMLDPATWSQRYPEQFDLVLVDAPCSGQSLHSKGRPDPAAFDPAMVRRCADRQDRIMEDAAKCVAPGGYLQYMTCTFAPEENEEVIAKFLSRHPEFFAMPVHSLSRHQSRLTDIPCYRLHPHEGFGAGGFTCLLRRRPGPRAAGFLLDRLKPIWKTGDPPRTPRQTASSYRKQGKR